jgi:hypothetical protein
MAKQNIFAKRAGHPEQQTALRANHPTEPFDRPRRSRRARDAATFTATIRDTAREQIKTLVIGTSQK